MSASESRSMAAGAMLVASGSVLFASKALFAKAAYAQQVPFELMTVMRALLSLPLFWVFALQREGWQKIRGAAGRAAAVAALAGVLCFYAGSLADFYALTFITASVERVLLFSYPAMVVVFTAVLRRQMPSRGAILASILTYLGIFLIMGGFDFAQLESNLVGGGFVLIAALFFAVYFMVASKHTREIGATLFSLYAMTAATVALIIHALVRGTLLGLAGVSPMGWLILLALAIGCMFLPVLLQAEGVRRIGAQQSSIVSTIGPPTTILLGWLLLGERLTLWQAGGVLLIVGGILTLDLKRTTPI